MKIGKTGVLIGFRICQRGKRITRRQVLATDRRAIHKTTMEDSIPALPSTPSDDDLSAYFAALASESEQPFDPSRLITLDVPQRFKAGEWTVFGSRNIQVNHSTWILNDDKQEKCLAGPSHRDKIPSSIFHPILGYGYTMALGTATLDDDIYKKHVAREQEWVEAFFLPSDSHHLQNFLRRRVRNVLVIGLCLTDVTRLTDVVLSIQDGCEHVQILGDELRHLSNDENPRPINFSQPQEHFEFGTPQPLMVFVVEPRSTNPQLSKVTAYCLGTAYIDFFQELVLSIKREWNILQNSHSAKSPYHGLPPGWAYQVSPIDNNADEFAVTAKMIFPLDKSNFSEEDMADESVESAVIQTYLPAKSPQSFAKETDQQLRDLFAQGRTIRQMAQALTTSKSTVKRDLKRLGLRRR